MTTKLNRSLRKCLPLLAARGIVATASRQSVVLKVAWNPRILPQRRWYSEEPSIKNHIDSLVQEKPVVVFMKGTPEQPQCGFSNAVCQILRMHGVTKFDSYNVLEDEELRQGIKEYSNWPTIPQVYMGGEFIGGCDIMIQMHQEGDLIEELKKVGIKSDLAD